MQPTFSLKMESVMIDTNFNGYLLIQELKMESSKHFASVLYPTWVAVYNKKKIRLFSYTLIKKRISYVISCRNTSRAMMNSWTLRHVEVRALLTSLVLQPANSPGTKNEK